MDFLWGCEILDLGYVSLDLGGGLANALNVIRTALEGPLKEKGLPTRGTKAQPTARMSGELCNKMRMSDNINSIAGYIYMPARQVVAQASSPCAQYTQSPPSAYAEASGSG